MVYSAFSNSFSILKIPRHRNFFSPAILGADTSIYDLNYKIANDGFQELYRTITHRLCLDKLWSGLKWVFCHFINKNTGDSDEGFPGRQPGRCSYVFIPL